MNEVIDIPPQAVRILDHGYLFPVEHLGSDERIVEAARMSTGGGFKGWGGDPCLICETAGRLDETDKLYKTAEDAFAARTVKCVCKGTGKRIGDEGLLRRLWMKKHTSPFEMCEAVFEVRLPLFVAREWMRHRTQSYNEFSARYSVMPDLAYTPLLANMFPKDDGNKQAAAADGAIPLTEANAVQWIAMLEDLYDQAEFVYKRGVALGVKKEHARLAVTVGRYTTMRVKANLLNWLKFLSLRLSPDAQYEIQVYARAVADVIKELYPRTYKLFEEGRTK